ncbi:MAG TPA: response regulator transcription factor [Jatrophihabitans sp.]|jgi:DNA-binding response OmpR family regulator|uniref:response regulator transcription factor n=1 Tax=Jatrophihabitans sp. TaxID=1932789 RepID=UPI002E0A57AF|nr:response regulator transcription factor [Jatrophihabitans sp.]
MARLLIIDGPGGPLTEVAGVLETCGFETETARSTVDGVRLAIADPSDLILLQLALPDGSGEHVLHAVLAERPRTQILVVCDAADIGRRVGALGMGAADAIASPFVIPELLARIEARLRWATMARAADSPLPAGFSADDLGDPIAEVHELQSARHPRSGGMPPHVAGATAFAYSDDLQLDPIRRCAVVRGRAVDLSQREFVLMSHLVGRRGQICTRRELLADVWGLDFAAQTNVVDVYIRRLRLKLATITIDTVRNVGYRLNAW